MSRRQKRQSIDLLISWFELRLPRKREIDTAEGFLAFVERMEPYLMSFNKKWVESDLPQRLVFDYEAYLENPIRHLTQAILFFDASIAVDAARVAEIVSDVRPAKDNRTFRFADAVPARMCA